MKVKNIHNLKNRFNYEAPIFSAALNGKLNEINDLNVDSILDINSIIAPRPGDTFLVKVSGESMINENIYDGDILVVNGKEEPKPGQIIISSLNGEMTVKKYAVIDDVIYLVSANEKFLPIKILDLYDFKIQGVVKHVIRKV